MTNQLDEDAIDAIIGEIEAAHDAMESSKMKHANFCKQEREKIKEVMKGAKSDGIPLTIIDALIGRRTLERKLRNNDEMVAEEQQSIFIDLKERFSVYKAKPPTQTNMFDDDAGDQDGDAAGDVGAAEQAEGAQVFDDAAKRRKEA